MNNETNRFEKRKNDASNITNNKLKQAAINGSSKNIMEHFKRRIGGTSVKKRSSHKPTVWFDDVPSVLIKNSSDVSETTTKDLVKPNSFAGVTKAIAIDCEFVGVGYGGKENALARVSIVNQFGNVLLDQYVRPKERITNYRTSVSGIAPTHMRHGGPAKDFQTVQKAVAEILKDRILVGHAVHHDLKVLMLSHPKKHTRDTASYKPFRALFNDRTPSLKALTERILRVGVQAAQHDSVEDARATMRLYTSVKRIWEAQRKAQRSGKSAKDIRKLTAHLNIPADISATNGDDSDGLSAPSNLQFTSIAKIALDTFSEFSSGILPCSNGGSNSWRQASLTESLVTGQKRNSRVLDVHGRKCSKKRSVFLEKRSKIRQRKKILSSSSTFLHY